MTTGRTVEEAKDRALDALGIDESELDFEVVDEPSTSLFGLRTRSARIRARVRPTRPRPKVDRRNRRQRRDGQKARGGGADGQANRKQAKGKQANRKQAQTDQDRSSGPGPRGRSGGRGGRRGRAASADAEPDAIPDAAPDTGADAGATADSLAPPAPLSPQASPMGASDTEPTTEPPPRPREARGAPEMSDITLDDQEPTAVDFVTGLVEAFGFDADVSARFDDDDDAIEIEVEGDDLGLLVGQRGTTLAAIAELTRTAVAQQHSGRLEGRLRVDVAGYRARRKEALIRFASQIADKVLDTGESVALEPMSPPDRKIVHDAVNDIDGVRTESRGEDRRRHVVVLPDED